MVTQGTQPLKDMGPTPAGPRESPPRRHNPQAGRLAEIAVLPQELEGPQDPNADGRAAQGPAQGAQQPHDGLVVPAMPETEEQGVLPQHVPDDPEPQGAVPGVDCRFR